MATDLSSSLDTIRVEHTGSLRRPPWLQELYVRMTREPVGEEEIASTQDRAVREVIARQESIGLPVVTDGELRRPDTFMDSWALAVSGYDVSGPGTAEYGAAVAAQQDAIKRLYEGDGVDCTETSSLQSKGRVVGSRAPVRSRLQLVKNIILEEYRLASAIASRPVKVTMIGPDRIASMYAYEDSRDVYADMDEHVADVVAIQRQMIAEVVEAGCRYVQIDEPGLTAYVDVRSLDAMRARGEDPDANLERSIRANNELIAGFAGVTFGLHICRGGTGGRGGPAAHRHGAYDAIAERVFGGLDHHRFLLEYDSEAAGGFEALRFVGTGRIAALGLISNNDPEIESDEYLKRRVDEASAVLPIEQLALTSRCGFYLSPSEPAQWAKLEAIVHAAADVWGT